jgi:hypothetical protein
MNRGDQREAVFRDAEDRERFLATLGQSCEKTQWQVHAPCLMSNHFRLKWIAECLPMSSWTYGSNLLHGKPNNLRAQEALPLCQ